MANKGASGIDDLIESAVRQAQKDYGPGAAQRASEALSSPGLWASTGSLVLDRAIAGKIPGGFPIGPKRGRVLHAFGDPSLGKSLLLDHIMKSVVDMGGICYVSETEGSRDPHFARAIGLNLSRVVVEYPHNLADLFDRGMRVIKGWRAKNPMIPILWGWDSVTLIESSRTYEVEMGGKKSGAFAFGGGKPSEIGDGCRKVADICRTSPTSFVILNQVREDPTVMFGKKKKATGGRAVPFFASTEIELTSSQFGVIKDDRGRAEGRWVHARVVKNKIARPFAECDFLIHFDLGIRPWSGVLEALEDEKIVSVKREKSSMGRKGRIIGGEFVVVATGEVLPLQDFVSWCKQTKVLEQEVQGAGSPSETPDEDAPETGDEN